MTANQNDTLEFIHSLNLSQAQKFGKLFKILLHKTYNALSDIKNYRVFKEFLSEKNNNYT